VDLFLKVMKRKDIRSILEKEAYAPR
jgi:hypothetical protein